MSRARTSNPETQSPITNHQRADIELVPIESDQHGNARRFAVARFDDPATSQPPAVIDAAPIVSPITSAQPRLVTMTEGSHQDRARAFSIFTWQLSLVTGALFVVAAIALSGATIPLLSLVLTGFGGFALTWLAAYVLHTLASAEGVELYGVWRLWNWLDAEQAERHRRYSTPQPRARWKEIGERVMAAFIIIYIGLFVLAWLYVRGGGQ